MTAGPSRAGSVSSVLSRAWSYVGAVMGDHDYQRYVTHQTARHPGGPVLSERDYWRMRHHEQEANPQSRCC